MISRGQDATPELRPEPRAGAPPAAAVLESFETMNTKPESEAPVDGVGRGAWRRTKARE